MERFVGNRAILRRARRALSRRITLEEASALARRGDLRARRIWKEAGETIGLALAGVVNTVNPEVIVVGGGVAGAGSVLLGAIGRTIRRHAMKQLKGRVRVRKASLGHDAGLIGSALLVKEDLS